MSDKKTLRAIRAINDDAEIISGIFNSISKIISSNFREDNEIYDLTYDFARYEVGRVRAISYADLKDILDRFGKAVRDAENLLKSKRFTPHASKVFRLNDYSKLRGRHKQEALGQTVEDALKYVVLAGTDGVQHINDLRKEFEKYAVTAVPKKNFVSRGGMVLIYSMGASIEFVERVSNQLSKFDINVAARVYADETEFL